MEYKRKIILTSLYYKPHFGGVESVLYSLSQICLQMGYEPIIVCSNLDLKRKPTLPLKEIIDGVKVIRFKTIRPRLLLLPLFYLSVIRGIRNTIYCKLNVDKEIIIVRNHIAAYAISKKKKAENVIIYAPPCLYKQDEIRALNNRSSYRKVRFSIVYYLINHYIKGFAENRMQAYAFKNADLVAVASKLFLNKIRIQFPEIQREKYVHIPFGVDTKRFVPISMATDKIKRECFKLRKNKKRIFIFLGRFVEPKGIIIGLEACRKISHLDFLVYLIGDGPLKNDIEVLIKNAKLEEKVIQLGLLSQPEFVLPAGDVLFFPSIWESFGNTLLEGMSCGLPGLCFRNKPPVTDLPTEEIIEHEKTGWLVKPGPDNFAIQMEKIINMQEKDLKKMKIASRMVCEKQFSWTNYLDSCLLNVSKF